MNKDFFKLLKSKKTSLIDEDNKKISQFSLFNKVQKLSEYFEDYSIIIIIADNCYEFIAGYISLMNKSKTIKILLDKSFPQEYIEKLVKSYKPNYIYLPINLDIKNIKILKTIKLKTFKILKTNFKKEIKVNYINYLLLPTSGTTQSAKFVRLSKNNMLDNTKKIINSLNIKKNHCTITTMPAGYSYGLSIINTYLMSGAKIVLNNNTLFEKKFWKKIKKFNVNSFGGVPEFYKILKKLDFEKFLNKSIKYLTQAGGKLEEDCINYFGKICKKNKIKFFIMYGQTEASPRITCLPWKLFFTKHKSVGKPLSGYRVTIKKNGKELKKPFEIGEIIVKGKNVSLGYAESLKDLKKGNTNKFILNTGDIGFKDKDGFVFITGRSKRIIKIFGKRFNLEDIENYLKKEGYKIRCRPTDNKLYLEASKKEIKNKNIINIISKQFSLNKNYIFLTSTKNTFKNYAK